jgi:nicotinamidase-related amidase
MRPMIVGKPALFVIDMQKSGRLPVERSGIPNMPGFEIRLARIVRLVEAARESRVPVIFFQEVHRPDKVDFGRELDGTEGVHCLEDDPATALVEELRPKAGDYFIPKRRYSAFFGTDLEILLRGLEAETLILTGELTDVCVHYTYVDGHQRDYYMRVVEDCCGGSTEARHEASLDAMEYLQTGARVKSDQVLAAFRARRKAA